MINRFYTPIADENDMDLRRSVQKPIRLRLFGVLNKQLEGREFVAGEYSIADMAIYPWVEAMPDHVEFPNIQAWVERIKARPAVQAAYATKSAYGQDPAAPLSDEAKKLLFGIQPNTTPVAKV